MYLNLVLFALALFLLPPPVAASKCEVDWRCPANAVQKSVIAGERFAQYPGFWAAIDACWFTDQKVTARLKVVATQNNPNAQVSMDAGMKGDKVPMAYVINSGGPGSNECSYDPQGRQGFSKYEVTGKKRILNISLDSNRGSVRATMKNPCVYGTSKEIKKCRKNGSGTKTAASS